ncbi:Isochorismatase hydrolase [Lentinula aciculospora]|uniref:Isochorismatase hydrolase n=1 Tax=Lentinula aciculospora TaxID=153920 RepID=A0A9W9AP02_9AGAR|nr:Isochorismatase hydrolase [Lentinula aciculospora]
MAPPVLQPVEYGDSTSNDFSVEYPNGLVDLSRSIHLEDIIDSGIDASTSTPPLRPGQLDIVVTGDRTVRVDTGKSALVIIDMQNFFLHQDIRDHPKGKTCVEPLLKVVLFFREKNIKILWVNWGLTDDELNTIPPSLTPGFHANHGFRGFGTELPGDFGRVLMRGEKNSELYGPLQGLYEEGRDNGTDFWFHKNRMSGLRKQTLLEDFLEKNGIRSLFFAGVNSDQCVLGTLIDAYHKRCYCILIEDATATISPDATYEAVLYNAGSTYGFVTCTDNLLSSRSL